ncbi:MAG: hypothetical protein ABFD98_14085 [Syntrophobacteraceae bacterium]|nr:hypothetical protein [Desulfobacteraceae bacterium]
MNHRYYLNGMRPTGSSLVASIVDDEYGNVLPLEFDSDEYRFLANEECVEKMCQPVLCNGHEALDSAGARRLCVELSWCFEPAETERNVHWSEKAKRKISEAIVHGHPVIMSRAVTDRLMDLL